MEQNINKPFKGLHTDLNPKEQPEGTYRYALNAVNESKEGEQVSISTEGSNVLKSYITPGFIVLGSKYIGDNNNVIISVNPTTSRQEIGIVDFNGIYNVLVNTKVLNLNVGHQVDIVFRIRKGNQRIIYWVDGLNRARELNIDRLNYYYTEAFKTYLESGGSPGNYFAEKWDESSFNLRKTYKKIPHFNSVETLDHGQVKPGSYNFAIQLVDADLNPTEWITVSNPVRIFHSSLTSAYGDIRGSHTVNEYQSFPEGYKTIKLHLGNLDTNFPYYRVAIIQATEGTQQVTRTLVSPLQDIYSGTFIYSGNDDAYEEMDVNEIRFDNTDILAPQHIEQLENRLVLANGKGPEYNWCDFQKYASAIKTDLAVNLTFLNEIDVKGNLKNPNSSFSMTGYMPGDVYSLGIVYLMKDFTLSPVLHIPGASPTSNTEMQVYEGETSYPKIHSCVPGDDYWGRDYEGNPLVGKNIRHHRFPTRAEADYSLYNTHATVQYYKKHTLKVRLTLKPNQSYPTDTNGNPLNIGMIFNYKIIGSSATSYIGSLNPQSVGIDIVIATETNTSPTYFDTLVPGIYILLDGSSQLSSFLNVFDLDIYHEIVDDQSVASNYSSYMFGLDFSNIEKPHPDVIGFYIVRNEVTEADQLIVDNAIMGANVREDKYVAFTSWVSGKSRNSLDNKSAWFFSPEAAFNKKNVQFNGVQVQGAYEVTGYDMPHKIINNRKEFADDPGGKLAGIYIEDVQSGSSYNPEVHKKREKDSDGFALHGAYVSINVEFSNVFGGYLFPKHESSFILDAASNRIINGDVYYNVSTDNRIGMIRFENNIDLDFFSDLPLVHNVSPYSLFGSDVSEKRLQYVSLIKGHAEGNRWIYMKSSYQDFMTRPYYKEHNNPMYFEDNNVVNNITIFNGDAHISSMYLTSSVFRQLLMKKRKNKTSVWRYIIGAILIIAGAVLAIFGGGSGVGLVAVGISVLAAGAMFVHSGIKLDNAIAMFTEDYSKGLLKAIEDPFVVTALGSPEADGTNVPNYIPYPDDTIQWFFSLCRNIYVESRVPVGLRSGVSIGQVTDFMNSPKDFSESVVENYITEKITHFDRDQGGGRLYRGIANAEVYSVNPDYTRRLKEKSNIHLPSSYDCCNEGGENFPTRVWYSQQSFQEELTDNYKSFLANNYRDIEGENGEITDLYKIANSLYIHTKEALWKLPQNLQERATNELTTYIGTGEFFAIPPQKIIDDVLGSGGTTHKWGTIKTKYGVISISEIESKVNLHSEGVKTISNIGMRNWFEEYFKPNLVQQLYDIAKVKYAHDNNPSNPVGVGYISAYDARFDRIIITKKDYNLIKTVRIFRAEKPSDDGLATLPVIGFELGFNTYDGKFWRVNILRGGSVRYIGPIKNFDDYADYFEDKSLTISYSFHSESWVSLHSYLPYHYLYNQDSFFSLNYLGGIYKHNSYDRFLGFYKKQYPYIIEYVANKNPLENSITEDIIFTTSAKKWDSINKDYLDIADVTYNKVLIYNSRQSSGEQRLVNKNTGNQEDYLQRQVSNSVGEILLDRNERNWSINQLRDYVVDYNQSLFSFKWDDIKSQYPIDKVPNNSVIDFNKSWDEVESFRDKYAIVRFKFDNFVDVKLTTHFFINTEFKSER